MSEPSYITTSSSDDIRGAIIQSYRVLEQSLATKRQRRVELQSEIAVLVDQLKDQRRLVRVVAPELLNGDKPDE